MFSNHPLLFIPSRVSGRGYKIGPVCLLVSTLTAELLEVRTHNLAYGSTLMPSRMSSKVKVTRLKNLIFFGHFYGVTCVD